MVAVPAKNATCLESGRTETNDVLSQVDPKQLAARYFEGA